MNRNTIWDLPTRLLHAMFVLGIFTAFAIANLANFDDGSFDNHAIVGLILLAVLVLRVLWGILGTRHARFSSYVFHPVRLIEYIKGALSVGGRQTETPRETVPYSGHNPATSLAGLLMFSLLLGVIITGILLGRGAHDVEGAHTTLVYALLLVIATHVTGVMLHSIRHREFLILAMLTGRKRSDPAFAITHTRPVVAIAMLFIVAAVAQQLFSAHDPSTHETRIPFTNTAIQLIPNHDEEFDD
jgi:cytochrome b